MAGRDIVVIGASMGGVEALTTLVSYLPGDLPATLFVVLHVASHSVLPKLLAKAGPLPASHAVHLERTERGRIYVAPPDRHLILGRGYVRVVIGPTENNVRPAADVLFRSAARNYGRRTVGVVLSGSLSDGTVGLDVIARLGGVTVAQDPSEAFCPDMPLSAIERVRVDHVLSIEGIAELITRLARDPLPQLRASESEDDRTSEDPSIEGAPSSYSCPECGGVLWELDAGGVVGYRGCVGHGYVDESLALHQSEDVETALWSALRALEEQVHLYRRMGQRARERDDVRLAARFEERADETSRQAALLRETLTAHVEKAAPAELEESIPAPEK